MRRSSRVRAGLGEQDRLSRNQNHIGVLFDEVQQAGARLEFVTEQFDSAYAFV